MGRHDEEPAWDTDSEKSGDESSFDDESGGDRSGSEAEDNDDADFSDDEDADGDSMASEDIGSEGGSSHSGSGSDDSESDDESDSDDEDAFRDEGGGLKKSKSSGSLMNEPSDQQPFWTKLVPNKIVEMGLWKGGGFICCMCLLPLLLIIVPLAVFFGRGKDTVDVATIAGTVPPVPSSEQSAANDNITAVPFAVPSAAPSLDGIITTIPTLSPTISATTGTESQVADPESNPPRDPVIKTTILGAAADTTIFLSGDDSQSPVGGDAQTMLIQNGPPGNSELPRAYALVKFDGIFNIDSDSMSVDAYLASIEDLVVEMCLVVVPNENENESSFRTCIIEEADADRNIEELSGDTAGYSIPASCRGGGSVDFTVRPGEEGACADVASLVRPVAKEALRNLRGSSTGTTGRLRRSLQVEQDLTVPPAEGNQFSYLFMIESAGESEEPGTQFYSKNNDEVDRPSLTIEGDNTCRTIVDIVCSRPDFSTLCGLVKEHKLEDFLLTPTPFPFKTLFAPTNEAFRLVPEDLMSDDAAIINVLKSHVAPGDYSYGDLKCGEQITMATDMSDTTTTLCNLEEQRYQIGSGVSPGDPPDLPIVSPGGEMSACYGTVHTTHGVIIPGDSDGNKTCLSEEVRDIAQVICDSADHTILCSMLRGLAMDVVLSGGMYTVFAPSNEAFELSGLANQTLDDDPTLATNVLMQHVVASRDIYSKDIACDMEVRMANGANNTITCGDDGSYSIAGPGKFYSQETPLITKPDIGACNGVIHVIDRVISPSNRDMDIGSEDPEDTEDPEDSEDDPPAFEPCFICGSGRSVTNMDTVLDMPEDLAAYTNATCRRVEDLCLSSECSPEICAEFAENGGSEPCGCDTTVTLIDLLSEKPNKYSDFMIFLETAGLEEYLENAFDITLFAPNNKAFAQLQKNAPTFVEQFADEGWIAHAQNLAMNHVLSKVVASSDITDGLTVTAESGYPMSFIVDAEDKIFINLDTTEVINKDSKASHGILHRINDVVLPPWFGLPIDEAAASESELDQLMAFAADTSFVEDVFESDSGPFTFFAPSNDAISDIMQQFRDDLVDLDTVDGLGVLSNHVVKGMYPASAIVDGLALTTELGEEIIFTVFDEMKAVDGKRIVSTDILANNGIIHVIEGVLLPNGVGTNGGEGAQTQSCSICNGLRETFTLTNPEAMLDLDEVSSSTTCALLEERCQAGLCDEEACTMYADGGASETCGCE